LQLAKMVESRMGDGFPIIPIPYQAQYFATLFPPSNPRITTGCNEGPVSSLGQRGMFQTLNYLL
jgi:hypothetical protein